MSKLTAEDFETVAVGSKIRFTPHDTKRWWNVAARNPRYIIASRQAAFKPKGTDVYTVVDLTGWTFTRNSVPPGVVRSSINLIGGGYDLDDPNWALKMLNELQEGTLALSVRRAAEVRGFELKENNDD
ncbi:hypothetical protein [Brevibacterium oceani]|uniref:hypothetical protein n=1 Tax=Brevibacterium oceani TaxID=358099 RepID=UPI0015E65856|nr:hypothetical protein [Brevibacterium oceani]